MKYEDFEFITKKMLKQQELVNTIGKYIDCELMFDNMYWVLERLLDQLYCETAISLFDLYFYENNKNPVRIEDKEYKCETIRELYDLMEMFNEKVEKDS